MSERKQKKAMTDAEIDAKVATRRRGTWGGLLLGIGGFVFAVVAMWKFQSLGLSTLGFGASMIAFGLVDPAQVKGLWR